jgi:hypothetical protein
VGIAYHRHYLIQHHIGMTGQFSYVYDLVGQTLNPLGQDLMNLKYDYSVVDAEAEDAFADKDLYFVGTAEYMSARSQQAILDALHKGKTIVLVGLIPRYDEEFKPSRILSRGLGLSTTTDWVPCNITWEKTTIRSIRYGFVSSRGSEKAVAKSGTKAVGVHKKVGPGTVYLFTFDIAAKYDPWKLGLISHVLRAQKITSPVSVSDPNVDLIAHVNEKGVILFLINTDTTFTSQYSTFTKKVVVSVDLAALGLRQAKVKMHDLLDEMTLDFTSKELKEGIVFSVGYHDARIFFIPKK